MNKLVGKIGNEAFPEEPKIFRFVVFSLKVILQLKFYLNEY